jgi:hypothetical protein
VKALSAAAAATAAVAATTTDKFEITITAARAARPWLLRSLLTLRLCRATKRPGHHRRSVVEEADRRGSKAPQASRPRAHRQPRLSEPEAAPGHRLGPSRRTGGVDGGRPVAHVSGLPGSLGMDNDPPGWELYLDLY